MKTNEKKHVVRAWALGFCIALVLLLPGAASAQSGESNDSYTNPVSKDFADTFADPAVIKGKDGYWYAYGTTDPLREGEEDFRNIPISRSSNLTDWEYFGDAFNNANRPEWAAEEAGLWAPDIRYVDGEYLLYYVVTDTTENEAEDSAIGVATAPTPAGPWKDSGEPVIGPRKNENGGFKWTYDPSLFTDTDGTHYLYYGSYNGGVFVTELSEDGERPAGEPTRVAIDNRYEGAYVVKRSGYYYLFASSANCCAGPTTGYSVYVGRSESPRGPFLDKQGVSMNTSRVGGTPVVAPNGNKWVGTGHNSVVTDLSGQDWLAYHAIDRADPYLNEPYGINERPMLLDRLDWVDGWPTVRAGEWASEGSQPAPTATGHDSFNRRGALGEEWERRGGAWRLAKGGDSGGYVRQQGAASRDGLLLARSEILPDSRVEGDLRLTGGEEAGIVVRYRDSENHATAYLNGGRNALVTEVITDGRSDREITPLPEDFAFGEWHNVAVELRGQKMRVEVTDARLNDPYAVAAQKLPETLTSGRTGIASNGRIEADNFSAARLYEPVQETAPEPAVGEVDPAYSDEFEDGALDEAWSWFREPDGEEDGGSYRWPVQEGDIVGEGGEASVLLREAPEGDYTVETRLDMDLGENTVRNFQQAGLIVYEDDDLWARLSHVAIWNTRQTEFGKEMPFAGDTSFGGTLVGPPADTTWLRLSHRTDPANGEHEFRAYTSRDGEDWVRGGVWTLPADADPRIGLVSLGRSPGDPAATAEFDYFRTYRL